MSAQLTYIVKSLAVSMVSQSVVRFVKRAVLERVA